MGHFATNTKSRSWVVTVHIGNMVNAGLTKEQYENPEFVADFFINTWKESGKNRTAAATVCVSAQGLYHMHMALYGNTSTLKNVAEIMYKSEVEPQLGGKKALKGYLLKEPPYDEKGEQVLHIQGIENVQNLQGQRSDLDEIEALLDQGHSPNEIMDTRFAFRKYEKMIKSAYISKRIKDTPLIKDMYVEWHCGESRSGKTYTYYQMAEKHSPENIYLVTDFKAGGLDLYIDSGAPKILFIDEFKGEDLSFGQLLVMLDKYSRSQTHCRYANTYNLWTTVIVTSIYPPDEVYSFMVNYDRQARDKIDQLLRRINVIVYHYIEDGEYKAFSLPASEYINYDDLKKRALNIPDGFIPMEEYEQISFDD